MAESQPTEHPRPAEDNRVPDLEPKRERELTDLVYRLMRQEIIQERERSGQRSIRR